MEDSAFYSSPFFWREELCDLQDDVSALHEALAVDDAVDEDAGDLYAAFLQAHSQTL